APARRRGWAWRAPCWTRTPPRPARRPAARRARAPPGPPRGPARGPLPRRPRSSRESAALARTTPPAARAGVARSRRGRTPAAGAADRGRRRRTTATRTLAGWPAGARAAAPRWPPPGSAPPRSRRALAVGLGRGIGVAEHVLRQPLAVRRAPVDRRAPLVRRQVPQAIHRHQLELLGHAQQLAQLGPCIGELHRRGDELDPHAEVDGGEPDVLDRHSEP